MRVFQMLEYLKAQDAVELKEKFHTAIKIATVNKIDPSIIDLLRKEHRSLSFMTANIQDGVMMRARKEFAGASKPIAGERVGVNVLPEIIHDDPS